ncbi:DUF2087 domain-containing protein [Microbacterium oleivorans]|uniref:DUF2087 domain-containing protein n=1 Tax=Microbacterium TaxID=33882 RepID=UPI0028826E00|nr:DUF2087 domain-containing protein [Microbacterium sp. ARD31]MDT0180875.1 DUF2087 domain-containing protein [Microbacterium sp. ARD31]
MGVIAGRGTLPLAPPPRGRDAAARRPRHRRRPRPAGRRTAFARTLAETPAAPRPTGVERFLSPDGRLSGYPARAEERRRLLALIAGRILRPGEVVDEQTVNERLAAISDDVAVLRRYLVDHELVERTRSGTEYAVVADPTAG